MLALEVHEVSKRYNQDNGIEQISCQVKQGSIFALCGGNGAGKSTLMQVIIGQLIPDQGKVTFSTPVQKGKLPFAYMPDDLEFPEQLTAVEIITFLANLHGVSQERAFTLLEEVGLEQEEKKRVRQYSKGMKQRLAFAQALLADAPVLILDEPTNGLDPYWVKRWKDLVLQEKAAGKTIIFSTHILPIVEEIADDVLFLYKGKMLLSGAVTAIRQHEQEQSLEQIFFKQIEKVEGER